MGEYILWTWLFQEGLSEMFFEEFGFSSLLRTHPADLSSYQNKKEHPQVCHLPPPVSTCYYLSLAASWLLPRLMAPASCHLAPSTCLLIPTSLVAPATWLLAPSSCLLASGSCPLAPVLAPVKRLLPLVSCHLPFASFPKPLATCLLPLVNYLLPACLWPLAPAHRHLPLSTITRRSVAWSSTPASVSATSPLTCWGGG